jgi:hypothetical protein
MILRHQRIAFWSIVGCIVLMAMVLFFHRERGRARVRNLAETTPLDAPVSGTESVILDMANDTDGSISATQRQIALPEASNARAQALIDHLVAEYAQTGSAHPLHPGTAVNEVFLVPLPIVGHTAAPTPENPDATALVPAPDDALKPRYPGDTLAIVDLSSAFVNQHPSGVEVETLTLLSIIGTLHANMPQIEYVKFLVDSQPRETLAGHADLLRTYPSRDTTTPVAASH